MLSDGLIGALIGGAAAVVASVLTNAVVAWNVARQHRHDAQQKVEDRKAAIRREVYPKVIEDVHALHNHFGALHSLPLDDESPAFTNMLQSTGKLWVIAEYETTVLSREYVNVIGESYLTVMTNSVPARRACERLRQLRDALESGRAKLAAAELALSQAAGLDDQSGVDLNALVDELTRQQSLVHVASEKYQELSDEVGPMRMDFTRLVVKEIGKSNEVFVKLICALRNEIGLRSNEAEFLSLVQEQQRRAMSSFENAFGELLGVSNRIKKVDEAA
jgi:hypothetical protein